MPRANRPLGYTLDSGVLIAIERRKRGVIELVRQAALAGATLHIPYAVVAEFWRGAVRKELAAMVDRCAVPETLERVKRAGLALAAVGTGPSTVDAIVAALADELGEIVLTTDAGDFARLSAYFSALRVHHV
ncbi:MAG TPA: PIN domain-containing protein [Polyangiales bacterium]|nr:PIN domain-containing protein [Polyangiales bacterium]